MREEEIVAGKEKKCCLLGCLFRLAVFAVTVYGAVTALAKVMKRLSVRLEEDNEGSGKKRFFSCLSKREIDTDEAVSEAEITTVAAYTAIDLSEAGLSEETFVKVRALGGKVVIKVPPMVRVKMEGKGVVCGFSNMVPNYEDESLPVIYVDVESIGACVKVKLG